MRHRVYVGETWHRELVPHRFRRVSEQFARLRIVRFVDSIQRVVAIAAVGDDRFGHAPLTTERVNGARLAPARHSFLPVVGGSLGLAYRINVQDEPPAFLDVAILGPARGMFVHPIFHEPHPLWQVRLHRIHRDVNPVMAARIAQSRGFQRERIVVIVISAGDAVVTYRAQLDQSVGLVQRGNGRANFLQVCPFFRIIVHADTRAPPNANASAVIALRVIVLGLLFGWSMASFQTRTLLSVTATTSNAKHRNLSSGRRAEGILDDFNGFVCLIVLGKLLKSFGR